jgi:hypothetical protein
MIYFRNTLDKNKNTMNLWGSFVSALLIFSFLISQYLGMVHSVYHGLTKEEQNQFTPVVFDLGELSQQSLINSHFSTSQSFNLDSFLNESNEVKIEIQSCKLFESLMLGICLSSSIFALLLLKNELTLHATTRSSPIYCKISWVYQSRAPPL